MNAGFGWRAWGVLVPLVGQLGARLPCQPAPTPGPAIVCWQKDRKLTWADFRAKTTPATPEVAAATGVRVGAVTEANAVVYERRTETGELVKPIVRVEFDPRKSWVNKHAVFDRAAALRHEQLHFDIVELTGRKIRRLLARCAAEHLDYHTSAITQEITAIYNAEIKLDSRYDDEAGHGDPRAQARWQAAIQKQLAALDRYKSTPADCEPPGSSTGL